MVKTVRHDGAPHLLPSSLVVNCVSIDSDYALLGCLTELAYQPQLGRRRDELVERLFSFPFESHIIFYQHAKFGIIVVPILHKRQDAPRHFE